MVSTYFTFVPQTTSNCHWSYGLPNELEMHERTVNWLINLPILTNLTARLVELLLGPSDVV